MNEQFDDFQRRVVRIHDTHGRRVPYSFTVRPDGLMVPRTRSRLRFYFPWRAILAGFVTTMVVKGFMIFYLGLEAYQERMEHVLEGSTYRDVASMILAPDPVSVWTAARMAEFAALLGLG